MIRFHVVHDQIIRLAAAQRLIKLVQPFAGEALIDGIHDGNFFIEDDVGIIGHAVGNGILSLKKINIMIVNADVADVV